MNIKTIDYRRIQPSQFHLSKKKIAEVKKWFNPKDLSNFEPLPIKELNGKIIFTDGHTRAFVAYSAGLKHIPLIFDDDDLDWVMYERCIDACVEKNIITVSDLAEHIVDEHNYDLKWNKWCDIMQKQVLKSKEEQDN